MNRIFTLLAMSLMVAFASATTFDAGKPIGWGEKKQVVRTRIQL